jgi:hypothetical protein
MGILRSTWLGVFALAVAMHACAPTPIWAVDVSSPAILQMYEAKWTTIENRMADIFQAGYGQMWLPTPER